LDDVGDLKVDNCFHVGFYFWLEVIQSVQERSDVTLQWPTCFWLLDETN